MRALLLVLGVIFVVSCKKTEVTPPPNPPPGHVKLDSLKISNPVDTLYIANSYKFLISGKYSDKSLKDLSDSVAITVDTTIVSPTHSTVVCKKSGTVTVKVTYQNLTVSTKVYVGSVEHVPVDPRLKSTGKGPITVPVLVLNYIPTADGYYIDHSRTAGVNVPLDRVKLKILTDKIIEKNAIEEGTKFRDYASNKANPYVNINVVDYINVFDVKYFKVGTRVVDTTDNGISNPMTIDWYNIDFNELLTRINLKYYVETLGVKEVWFTSFENGAGYQSYNVAESNMSSPLTGDISNSDRNPNDLPVYTKTYVVYGDNGWRGVDTDLHNRGHQLESQLSYVDNANLLWTMAFTPKDSAGGIVSRPRLGNTHFCPNSVAGYDYWNTRVVKSDIMDWKPSGGTLTDVNVNTWVDKRYAFESNISMISPGPFPTGDVNYSTDAQTKWFIFWWQSIPGYNNTINDNGKKFNNWWDIFYNWEDAVRSNKRLTQ